jgi:hypothetical protein
MSRPAPKLTFTTLWNPIALPVKEAPSVGGAVVQRLDDEVLVLQTNQQVNLHIGLGMIGVLLMMVVMSAFIFFDKHEESGEFIQLLLKYNAKDGVLIYAIQLFIFGCVCLQYPVTYWLLNLTLFQARPCPVVLNRRTQKAYGSHRGKLVELDWKNITPIITEGLMALNGVQRSCHLVFAELDPPRNPARRTRKGKGFMVYSHPAWGWSECRGFWEFIRTYMEEKPSKLPPVLITPPVRTVDNLLAEGPYADFNPIADNWTYIQKNGRAKMGWQAVVYFICAPFLLFNALQLFCRRQVKIPSAALPSVQSNANSAYQLTTLSTDDVALWRKASRRVAWHLLGLMTLGMAMYIYIASAVIATL